MRARAALGTSMSRRGWLLFASMCVIWGIPYLLIKVAVRDITPSMLVLARTALGAALLLPIAAFRGQLRAVLRRPVPLVAFAGIEIALAVDSAWDCRATPLELAHRS